MTEIDARRQLAGFIFYSTQNSIRNDRFLTVTTMINNYLPLLNKGIHELSWAYDYKTHAKRRYDQQCTRYINTLTRVCVAVNAALLRGTADAQNLSFFCASFFLCADEFHF